ncbi:hypothetical protein SESBI_23815 [Sesbania bispinosa]|nr:hypothetical protein SESBI_23815 [Sesbania bispinosa]
MWSAGAILPPPHGAKGHDTEDCWTLMNRIERLIKEGYLGRYIEKRKGRGDKDQRRDEEGSGSKRRREDRHKETRGKEEVRGVVTTIAGGFTEGGETSSARRRYARQVMTTQADLLKQGNNHPMIAFTNEDFRGIQPHQDDPMVIDVLKVRRRNWPVKKIEEGDPADNHKVFFAELNPREDFFERRPQSTEELEEVQIGEQVEQKTRSVLNWKENSRKSC